MKLKDVYLQAINELKKTLVSLNQNPDFLYTSNDEKYILKIKKQENSEENQSKQKLLDEINEKVKVCNKCMLAKKRINTVFGEGNINAEIMFIGEGPGEQEDKSGKPFVGHAGQLLTDIIEKGMKLKREDVYISNIVKCRPPGNRNPEVNEVASCINYIYEQIKIINPKIIVLLGNIALTSLLPKYTGITKYRGNEYILILDKEHKYKVIPTYHPSYLLRGTESEIKIKKKETWEDIKKVLQISDL